MFLRGFLASAAAICQKDQRRSQCATIDWLTATTSVPTYEKAACVKTEQNARNRPTVPPMFSNCTNGPGFFQYRKPIRSWLGPPVGRKKVREKIRHAMGNLAAEIENNAQDNQASDCDNFNRTGRKLTVFSRVIWSTTNLRKNEFRFSICTWWITRWFIKSHKSNHGRLTCAEHVDEDNYHYKNSDPHGGIGTLVPKANQNWCSTQFSGKKYSPIVPDKCKIHLSVEWSSHIQQCILLPIVPSHGKRERRVHKSFGKFYMSPRNWEKCYHLTDRYLKNDMTSMTSLCV